MITVTVRIHGSFRRWVPAGTAGEPFDLGVAEGLSVAELLQEEVGLPAHVPRVVLVNGLHAGPDTELKSADRVSVFSPVAGG